MKIRRTWLIVAALLALVLTACSDATGDTTAAPRGSGDVEFLEGVIPDTVPDDFPIPDQAAIGTALVDHNRAFTQVIIRARSSLGDVVAYYEDNLIARGWDVSRSEQIGDRWEIAFERDGAEGMITVQEPGPNLSQAVIAFGDPAG